MKKKLKLSDIKIESFVTAIPDQEKFEGGNTESTACTNAWCTTCSNCLSMLSYQCCSEAWCQTATCPSHQPCSACQGTPCFLEGTLVNTDGNRYKAIQELKIGDSVISFNERTGKIEPNKIINIYKAKQPSYQIINNKIKTTPYHPFLVNGEWKEVRFMKVGDELRNNKQEAIIVDALEIINKDVTVFNIEVEHANTFYIHDILVHNKRPGGGGNMPLTGPICGGSLT